MRAGDERRHARRDAPPPGNQPLEDLLKLGSRARRPWDDRPVDSDPDHCHHNQRRHRPDKDAAPAGELAEGSVNFCRQTDHKGQKAFPARAAVELGRELYYKAGAAARAGVSICFRCSAMSTGLEARRFASIETSSPAGQPNVGRATAPEAGSACAGRRPSFGRASPRRRREGVRRLDHRLHGRPHCAPSTAASRAGPAPRSGPRSHRGIAPVVRSFQAIPESTEAAARDDRLAVGPRASRA